MKQILAALIFLAMVALAGCGGSVSVTQTGGGAQSGTSGPSGTGTGTIVNNEPAPVTPAPAA
jgi:hypothetical protein